MAILNHVAQHLAEQATAARRKAAAQTCRDCQAVIIVGLDDDAAALVARADPTPITWAAELIINITHRRHTYALIRAELNRRDPGHLVAESQFPVLPEHKCGHPAPDHWHAPETRQQQNKEERNCYEPPF